MSLDEIILAANAKQAQNKEFAQLLAWTIYNGATLFSVAANDPKKFPKIEDAFPTLFEKREQQEWWLMKERMEDWAKAKREEKG